MKRWLLASLLSLVSLGYPGIGSFAQPVADEVVREEDRLGARSDEYSRIFDKAITCLVMGDAGCFRALISPFTVTQETRGPGAIDMIIKERYIPYFKNFEKLSEKTVTVPSFDMGGNSGMAICRSFLTVDGKEKHFVLYVNEEKGRFVVGNLLLDTTSDQVLAKKKR